MKKKSFLSFDIELLNNQIGNNQIPAVGVVTGVINEDGEFKIKDRKTFYGKINYNEVELSDFWKENIKVLKKSQLNAVSQKQMARQINGYIIKQQIDYPDLIITSDFGSFDIAELNNLFKTHGLRPLRYRRNAKEGFFMDLDLTSFAAGYLFSLDPKNSLKEGWEWGLYKKIFEKVKLDVKNEFNHDHNPVNDASKNLFEFLTLLKFGMNKKRKRKEEDKKESRPKKRFKYCNII